MTSITMLREGSCKEGKLLLLLLHVRLYVHCELRLAGETQLAVRTCVSVGLKVAGEGPLPTASVITCGTSKLLAATAIGVCTEVVLEVNSSRCTEWTLWAGKRFLSCVCLYVSVYVTVLGRPVGTMWTGKWLLSSMSADMFLHVVFPRSYIRAARTLVYLPWGATSLASPCSSLSLGVTLQGCLLKMLKLLPGYFPDPTPSCHSNKATNAQ